jgi:hypothetical protein
VQNISKDGLNEFVVSQKISSSFDIKTLISHIQNFYGQTHVIINYDLLIKEAFIPLLEKILKVTFSQNSDGTFSQQIRNLFFQLRPLYFINFEKKQVENL